MGLFSRLVRIATCGTLAPNQPPLNGQQGALAFFRIAYHQIGLRNGKFLVLWKKTPGGWKMFRDSFSSDRRQ